MAWPVAVLPSVKAASTFRHPKDDHAFWASVAEVNPYRPSQCPPGSPGKVTLMAARYQAGAPIWDPADAGFESAVRSLAEPESLDGTDPDEDDDLDEDEE